MGDAQRQQRHAAEAQRGKAGSFAALRMTVWNQDGSLEQIAGLPYARPTRNTTLRLPTGHRTTSRFALGGEVLSAL